MAGELSPDSNDDDPVRFFCIFYDKKMYNYMHEISILRNGRSTVGVER